MRKRSAGEGRRPPSAPHSHSPGGAPPQKTGSPATEERLRQGQARFRALVETATDWIWEVDSSGKYTYASPKVRDLLGYEPGEVLGKTPFDLMLPEEAERLRPVVGGFFSAGRPFANLENLNRHKDGHLVLLETSGNPIIDAKGRLQGYRGVDRDITERRRAEEERRCREEEFRAIVETTNEWIWTIDAAGRHTYSNPALQRILGYSPAEFLGQSALHYLHPDDQTTVAQMMASERIRKEGWSGLLLRWRHKDGSYRFLESNAVPVFDAHGAPAGFRGADRDITDRRRVEAERDRQFELSIDLLCLAGFDGRLRRVNPAWIKTLGWTETELTTRGWLDFVHPDDRAATSAAGARLAAGERVLNFVNRYRCKDGSYRWLAWNSFPVPDEGLIIGVVRDVTEQRLIEEALRESEARFRSLYENSPDAILLTVPDGRILAANPAATRMFGCSEAEICRKGRPGLLDPDDLRVGRLLTERAATGAALGELTFRRANGTQFPGEVSSSVFAGPDGQARTCMVIHDISQRKQAEAGLLDSERRYRLLMENISDVVWVLDAETLRFRYVSPAVERLRGYTADEVLQQDLAAVLTPQSFAYARRVLAERLEQFKQGARGPYTDELEQPCKDGLTIWTEATTHLLPDDAGRLLVYGVSRDITARRKAEEELRASEERFSKAFHLSPLSMAISTLADGMYREVNDAFVRLTGYEREEVIGHASTDLKLWVDADSRNKVRAEIQSGHEVREMPILVRAKSGAIRDALYSAVVVRLAGVPHLLSLVLDVTERKRAEEASRESEERYRRLFELESDAILLVDSADGGILEVNAAAEVLYGYSRDEWLQLKVTEISTEPEKTLQVLAEKRARVPFRRHRRKDGTIFPVEVTISYFEWHGRPVHIAAVRDITERVRIAERTSQLSNLRQQLLVPRPLPERLRLVTEATVAVFSADFARIWMIGQGDLCAQGCWHATAAGPDACPDRTRCLHLMASSGRYTRLDGEQRRIPLGAYRLGRVAAGTESGFVTNDVVNDPIVRDRAWAESLGLVSFAGRKLATPDGQPIGVLAFFGRKPVEPAEEDLLDDIAATASQVIATALAEQQQREFERRMQETQKLESLGVLAGGIAHDFNNLLTAILGHASLARMDVASDSRASASLQEIETASGRAAELCRQMLAYAGKGRFAVESINLSRLIQELVHLFGVSISKKTRLRTQLPPDLPFIEVDAAQIRQVVMNLVLNAAEAIGDAEGDLAIVTGTMPCDEAFLRRVSPADPRPPGPYVFLEVTDTGAGIDPEMRTRIFEPFYTTKFAGRGLGLAAVQGIVRKHNGLIRVESERGRGTTFQVFFPAGKEATKPVGRGTEPPAWRSHGTILLVDDEDAVRLVAAKMLERFGFAVLRAADGNEAVEIFRQHSAEIGCVLLDLTMPGLSGEETYQELRRIRAEVPVILASGYSEHELDQRFRAGGLAGFIHKPYEMKELYARVRAVLSVATPAPGSGPPAAGAP